MRCNIETKLQRIVCLDASNPRGTWQGGHGCMVRPKRSYRNQTLTTLTPWCMILSHTTLVAEPPLLLDVDSKP